MFKGLCEFCRPLHISPPRAHLEQEDVCCLNPQQGEFSLCCGCRGTHMVGNDWLSALCLLWMSTLVREKYCLWIKWINISSVVLSRYCVNHELAAAVFLSLVSFNYPDFFRSSILISLVMHALNTILNAICRDYFMMFCFPELTLTFMKTQFLEKTLKLPCKLMYPMLCV